MGGKLLEKAIPPRAIEVPFAALVLLRNTDSVKHDPFGDSVQMSSGPLTGSNPGWGGEDDEKIRVRGDTPGSGYHLPPPFSSTVKEASVSPIRNGAPSPANSESWESSYL